MIEVIQVRTLAVAGREEAEQTQTITVQFERGLPQFVCEQRLKSACGDLIANGELGYAAVEPIFPGHVNPRLATLFSIRFASPHMPDHILASLKHVRGVDAVQMSAARELL